MAVHILTLACPDRPGIVARVSEGLSELDVTILENAPVRRRGHRMELWWSFRSLSSGLR